MKTVMKAVVLALVALSFVGSALAAEFPLRETYPSVKPISLEELNAQYDATLVIDVRSEMEFDVVHISKAQHIPVTKATFLAELEKVRAKKGATPIAFYCNGHTCAKSYKAAVKAMDDGFENVYCFDAGIFEWVSTYPEKGSLLGETPVPAEKLISKDKLNAHKIEYADFEAKAKAGAMVVDVRDPYQRSKDASLPQNKALTLKGVRNIPIDRLVGLLEKGEFKSQALLITDAVGKQVRWLQYYLEKYGYQDYSFLAKGVLSAADAGAVK